jgi:hypothetical protein
MHTTPRSVSALDTDDLHLKLLVLEHGRLASKRISNLQNRRFRLQMCTCQFLRGSRFHLISARAACSPIKN